MCYAGYFIGRRELIQRVFDNIANASAIHVIYMSERFICVSTIKPDTIN